MLDTTTLQYHDPIREDLNTHTHDTHLSSPAGVCWDRGAWKARLSSRHLGHFHDEREAAMAYDAAARKEFKDPILNFLPDGSDNPERKKKVSYKTLK